MRNVLLPAILVGWLFAPGPAKADWVVDRKTGQSHYVKPQTRSSPNDYVYDLGAGGPRNKGQAPRQANQKIQTLRDKLSKSLDEQRSAIPTRPVHESPADLRESVSRVHPSQQNDAVAKYRNENWGAPQPTSNRRPETKPEPFRMDPAETRQEIDRLHRQLNPSPQTSSLGTSTVRGNGSTGTTTSTSTSPKSSSTITGRTTSTSVTSSPSQTVKINKVTFPR